MGSSSPGAFVIQFTPELVLQLAEEDGGKAPKRRASKPKPKSKPLSPKSKPEPLPSPGVPPMFGVLPRPSLPGYQHPPFHHAVPPVPPRGEIEDEKPDTELRKEELQNEAAPDEFRRGETVSEPKEEEVRYEAPKEEIPHRVEEKEEVKFEKNDESEFRHLDEEQSEEPVVVARDLQPLMKILEKTEKYSEELQKRGLGELEDMKQRAQELQHKQYKPVSKTVPCLIEREACIKCYKEKDALQCRSAVEALKRCTLEALRSAE